MQHVINIGGIKVKIISTTDSFHLLNRKFNLFSAENQDIAPVDIIWRFTEVPDDCCKLPILDLRTNKLFEKTKCFGTHSSLLCSPHVQNYLHLASDHADLLTVELMFEALTIYDFKINCANIYFSNKISEQHKDSIIGHLMFAVFMPNFESMLIHSSAVIRPTGTAIFLAADEGGKTTAATMAPSNNMIISDDQVLVSKFFGKYEASGTPWGLYTRNEIPSTVGGIFILKKANEFHIDHIFRMEMYRFIWEEHKSQFSILPEILQRKAKDIIHDICDSVSCWMLSFPKDYIDWKEIDRLMKSMR